MQDEQPTDRQAERQEEEEVQKALERERLGGPADYDEAGGTGLAGGSSGDTSSGTADSKTAAGERPDNEDSRGGRGG